VFVIRSGFAVLLAAGTIGAATATAAPAKAPACDRQILHQIDSAWIVGKTGGVMIDAFGVAQSAGWSSPTLVVTGSGNGTVNVDFVACSPDMSAQVLTPIQTRATLDIDLATTRQIVIRAKVNSMTVEISK
jgi:hypothetical protein